MTMSFESEILVSRCIAKKDVAGVKLDAAIENIIKRHGFSVNAAKLKLRSRRERQEVTGLVVNQKVNVRRELVKRLHTQLHCVEKFGLEAAARRYFELEGTTSPGDPARSFSAKLRGRIGFVKMVRRDGDPVFAGLAKRFNKANIHPLRIKYFRRAASPDDLRKSLWVIEVGYDDPNFGYRDSQGTAFVLDGVGFVTCAHVVVDDKTKRPFKEIYIFRVGAIYSKYRAYVASYNPVTDLAILYVEGIDYYADCDVRLKLSPIEDLPGQTVQMVGFPSYREGQSPFIAKTEVAAVHGDYIEVGGQVIGGISGGPLLDSQYRVVGVITRGVLGGGSKNEAIRASHAHRLDFRQQSLDLLEPLPPLACNPSPLTRESFMSKLLALLLRVRRTLV